MMFIACVIISIMECSGGIRVYYAVFYIIFSKLIELITNAMTLYVQRRNWLGGIHVLILLIIG